MGTVSARVPDEIEAMLEEYVEAENVERSTAIRQLLTEGLSEWRVERALALLADGEVTLSRAAEIADVSVWELQRRATDADVTWVAEERTAEDLEDV